jgi:mannose-1-phosphate guanylyltransferase
MGQEEKLDERLPDLAEMVAINNKYTGYEFYPIYVLDIAKNVFGTASYQELFDNYANLTKISFDYAVVEKEPKIQVMRFAGEWKDLGTWNTLTEAMSDEVAGNAIAADCENTHVINELQIPLIALGTKDLAICSERNQS